MESNSTTATNSPGTSDRWLILALVSLDYFTLYIHRKVINFIQPALREDLGVSDLEIGFLDFAFLLPYCAAQIWVIGILILWVGRRNHALAVLAVFLR